MATERVIDLAGERYADREYAGELPAPRAEAAQEARRDMALTRLRRRAGEQVTVPRPYLDRADLIDILLLLGVNDW